MKQPNWNHIKASSLILLTLGFVSMGFQNCSKVGVQDLGSSGDSAKLDDNSCSGCSIDDPQGDGSGDLPDGSSSHGGQPHTQPLNEEAVVIAECLKHEGLQMAGPEVVGIHGNVSVSSDALDLVYDIGGNVKIQGKTAQAHAKVIRKVGGGTLICGMDVDSIEDVHGNLTLVNSKVANINLVGGNLRLFHSEVGTVSNVNGNIR